MFVSGQILEDKYEIIERIGAGGGGTVYKAFQRGLNRYVAVKLIKEEIRGALDEHGEADILKNLKNDHIPQVYDFIETDGKVYTVMEYIEGSSLKALLDSGKRFSKREVYDYTRQLCEAAAYLHSRRPPIIHSDIKPANIMLTPDGNICLIDYNISLMLGGSAVGVSDGYSPPEQYGRLLPKIEESETSYADSEAPTAMGTSGEETILENSDATVLDEAVTGHGRDTATRTLLENNDETVLDEATEAHAKTALTRNSTAATLADRSASSTPMTDSGRRIDKRSDVYSIGATAYHMACGIRPAKASEACQPLDGSCISESFAAIVNKAMQREPSKRFADAEQMLRALNNIRRYDRRYKAMLLRQELAAAVVISAMAASCIVSAGGWVRLGEEKAEKYDSYISEMKNADISSAEEYYSKASTLFPERAEAYEEMAYLLWKTGDNAAAAEFVNDTVKGVRLVVGENGEPYSYDKLYYILGRCYLDMGENELSAEAFDNAVSANSSEPEYYRDYAVALARCGNTRKAAEILEMAEGKGLGNESVLFAQAEIEFAAENYRDCIDCINECIAAAEDEELLYRAYVVGANGYAKAYYSDRADGDERIRFLNDAISRVPLEKAMPLYEMLALANIDMAQDEGNSSYYMNAITAYEEMNKLGWETADSDYALVRLYRIIGNHSYAKELAESLIEKNGDDYVLYKLLAFIETDIQNERKNSERDYSNFCLYYQKAKELCTDSEDLEMQRLDEAYKTLEKEKLIGG